MGKNLIINSVRIIMRNEHRWRHILRQRATHVVIMYTRVGHTSLKMPSKWENFAHTCLICFFNIITYLLLNSDYGIGCVYSPFGLVIFVAVEGTFVCFTKGHDHFISNFIRYDFLRQDQCNVACLESCMHWQLAVVTLRGGNELRLLIYAVRVCRFPPLFI